MTQTQINLTRNRERTMRQTWWKSAATVAFACGGIAIAQEAPPAASERRSDLIDQQLDVSLEARDIERILTKVKKASDLAKQRITEAAQTTESITGSLEKGDIATARTEAEKADAMFKEIVMQLEALLEEETPERLRAAQKLAEKLAETERQFAKQFEGQLNPTGGNAQGKIDPKSMKQPPSDPKAQSKGSGGAAPQRDQPPSGGEASESPSPKDSAEKSSESGSGKQEPEKSSETGKDPQDGGGNEPKDDPADGAMTEEERREALAQQAEEIAASGETLEDVLKAIMASTDPADQDAVRKVDAILREADFQKAIDAMKEAAGQIRSGELDDARLAGLDVADRMEILSQRLDAAYQLIVAPRAEELRKLEEALSLLRDRLEQLETESQVAAWHREARQLLDQLDQMGIAEERREELMELMAKAGFSPDSEATTAGWTVSSGRYVPPEQYGVALVQLQDDIQRRLQTLLLGDIDSGADEATPTKYKDYVDRYLEVLSREKTAQTKPAR